MSIFDTIYNRRSVRKYKDKKIEREKLEKILEAGRLSPSAKNEQNWKFIMVDDPELLAEVAKAMPQAFGKEAKAILIGCGPVENTNMRCGQPRGTVDLSIATTVMQLVAWEEGIGSCWIGSFNPDIVNKALEIENPFTAMTMLTLGYADEYPERKPRKDKDQVYQFNK